MGSIPITRSSDYFFAKKLSANDLHLHLSVCHERPGVKFMSIVFSILKDTVIDALKILPFLFITYLIMEFLEHHTQDKTGTLVSKAGHLGPLFGGLIGIFPQCGFSAAASNLYAGRVISLGTLIAIYLSTSDEMLPLLISSKTPVHTMLSILGMKALIGILSGFIIDLTIHTYHRKHHQNEDAVCIEKLCEKEHCHCEENESIFRSALIHTLHIFYFVVIFTLILNAGITMVGQDRLASLLQGNPIVSHLLAGLIGLIPNCAASVIITELYLEHMITLGSMMSGLLVGAGVGLLVLYRVNAHRKENIQITVLLYLVGVFAGILIDLIGIRI